MAHGNDLETLVLGGSGFLGTHLVRAALGAFDGSLVSAGRFLAGLPDLSARGSRVRAERVDARDLPSVEALLERLRPARILNAAANSRVLDCERAPDSAALLNAELAGLVARWCARRGARLVHVSTDLVFGARPAPAGGFREADLPQPFGVYGATKAAGERAVLEAHSSALVVRLPLLYGDSGGRGLGASDALVWALARGERPALFVDEWRTPLSVVDAAQALVELAAGAEQGILHVAGPERASRYELGIAVLGARGVAPEEARALIQPMRRAEHDGPPRAEDVSLDAQRARALLGTPLHGIADGLAGSSALAG